jgi:hypothetical protein
MRPTSLSKRAALPVLSRQRTPSGPDRTTLLLTGYGVLGLVAFGIGWLVRDGNPIDYPTPWLTLEPVERWLSSSALGLGFALALVLSTRLFVRKFRWAKELHQSFRPFAKTLSTGEIVALAVLSSSGEELLFRALLTPWMGVPLAALVFGVVHQMPGKSRWVWALWAGVVGLVLGCIYASTGALIGCVLAHALINGANLLFLRDYDEDARRRPLDRLEFRRRLSTPLR